MPLGLNRTDLNVTGITYLHGFPVNLNTLEFGNLITWFPESSHFGNVILLPLNLGNAVNWRVETSRFGNYINFIPTPPPTVSGIELEDGSGVILLENGDILLLEVQ